MQHPESPIQQLSSQQLSSPFAGNLKNHSYLHPDTEMARYHDNLLFTIQELCFIDIGHPMDAQWTPNGRPNGRPMDAYEKWGFGDSAFKEKVSTFDTHSFF